MPPQAALRAPGTNVKVGTEPKGDRELSPSRWWRELTVIHTKWYHCSHRTKKPERPKIKNFRPPDHPTYLSLLPHNLEPETSN